MVRPSLSVEVSGRLLAGRVGDGAARLLRDDLIGHHPAQAHDDHRCQDGQRDADIGGASLRAEIGEDRPQLQADQHESHGLEHEYGGLPHRIGWNAQTGARAGRGRARQHHGVDHDGDDAGEMEFFGQDPDAEGRDELEDDRARRIVEAPEKTDEERAEQRAEDEAPDDHEAEGRQGGSRREAAGDHSGDRNPVDQQRRGVVEETFPLQDDDEAMRRAHAPQDGGRGDGIGRGDDRAQRHRCRPGQIRQEPSGDGGNGDRRYAHGDDDQAPDSPPSLAKIPHGGVEGGVEQDRRDEERQHQLRVERDLGRVGNEGDARSRHRQHHRIGNADTTRGRREQDGGQHDDQDRFEQDHRRPFHWGEPAP